MNTRSKPFSDRFDKFDKFDKKSNNCCDSTCGNCGKCGNDADGIFQDAIQKSDIGQGSDELIIIRDSCDVTVTSTDTQIALSLQVALQVAIAIVINIAILDDVQAEDITNRLLQKSAISQMNRQKVLIEGSQDVTVSTTDTDVAISIQLLIQLLVAVVVQLDIL
ncbi:spore coat protein [Priestia filamentosa]|uniref:spore coat protein n=1 Tax=Priestia filamentosa TaxID=1402861 RepID=UPI00397C2CDF